jgi:MFS family permease
MGDFAVGSQEVQWVLSASLLALAGLLVLGGRLGDLLGRRRMFLAGTTIFIAASAVGGLAPDFWLLIAARAAQGVGGALMLPLSIAIVSATFRERSRGRALGTMAGWPRSPGRSGRRSAARSPRRSAGGRCCW